MLGRPLSKVSAELFTASLVVLFQELTLIRWLPGQVRVLAYFPNLILISAFLGLGLGCLRSGRRSLLWLWPTGLLSTTLIGWGMSFIAFTQKSSTEHLWLLYFDLPENSILIQDVRPPIILVFILGTLCFMPLGQMVAERLREFRSRSNPLWGYSWDILGSLMGVITFAMLGFFQTPPVVWFSVFLALGFTFFRSSSRQTLMYAVFCASILVIVVASKHAEHYSPYYAISKRVTSTGVTVMTNGSLHQQALFMRRSDKAEDAYTRDVRAGYHIPYRLIQSPPRRALVLGAGTGNDVAVLLDEGAERIDALEIDPVILEIGRKYHPNKPYDSEKVHPIVNDARSFLNATDARYDLIVFGTLDSMTKLSALSNVRLDNFVYTKECIQAARRHLTEKGGIVMYFMVSAKYIDNHLLGILEGTFGEFPLVDSNFHFLFNRIFMAGPAFAAHDRESRLKKGEAFKEFVMPGLELPSDDWPYLYLSERGVSNFYLTLIAIFMILALAGVALVSRGMRESLLTGRDIDREMFLFGLAFLLLETKSLTEMNLIFGATWLTSAVVFGAILLMVLLSTIVTKLHPLSWRVASVSLVFTLLTGYLFPMEKLLVLDLSVRIALSVLFVGLPIFFAGTCFALIFGDRKESDTAFGWNLLGAVMGGLLEFLSMAVGLKALSLLALAAYLLAFLLLRRKFASASGDDSSGNKLPYAA